MNPLARAPRRTAFFVYAAVIATLTHWPGLRIEGPVPRPDLFVHAGVFGLWTLAAIAAEWFGPWREPRAIAASMILAAGYAAADEWTQQFVGRVTTLDDFAANLLGVALAGPAALAGAAILGRVRPHPGA